ncbi:hypothetical protein A6R68_03412 [Neotoma lepida]|uniref:Uncharacterized protein n=1 Tax=Neotoma lepida TaxID=56216 RepID=A0A1A6GRR1_NEOLE|nr:hypothetical protein A6R68_03412 [Neotoma lepida]
MMLACELLNSFFAPDPGVCNSCLQSIQTTFSLITIFNISPNTLVAITVLVYSDSTHEYTQQLPPNFSYINNMFVNSTHLVLIILLFISHMTYKSYLTGCVWNLYPGTPLMFWFMLPAMTQPLCNQL